MRAFLRLSLAITIALVIIVNEMSVSEAATLKDKHQLALKLNRLLRKRSYSHHQNQQFDQMNHCILSCVKCSNEDLNDHEEQVCFLLCR
jgi:hypothetical protein